MSVAQAPKISETSRDIGVDTKETVYVESSMRGQQLIRKGTSSTKTNIIMMIRRGILRLVLTFEDQV